MLLLALLSLVSCLSHAKDLPDEWAAEWQENARLRIAMRLPYLWGGDSVKEGGWDCSGLLYDSSPVIWKMATGAKRSTSARMQVGMDGWSSRSVTLWPSKAMDLGFIPGHVFAVSEGHNGLLQIIHSRSSRGPIEEPYPLWIDKQKPAFRRLVIPGE